RIHLQRIRLHLLLIVKTDLTCLFIYFIADNTALSHEKTTSLFPRKHMSGYFIFQRIGLHLFSALYFVILCQDVIQTAVPSLLAGFRRPHAAFLFAAV